MAAGGCNGLAGGLGARGTAGVGGEGTASGTFFSGPARGSRSLQARAHLGGHAFVVQLSWAFNISFEFQLQVFPETRGNFA